MHLPRSSVVVVVAAAALVGIGLATAAVGDGEEARSGPAAGDGQAVERYYGPECGEQIPDGTHGDYVRRAARSDDADVSTVARSDCGKPLPSAHEPRPDKGKPPKR